MDTGLLSCANTDCLTILDIAYGVGLGIFQRNQRDQQVSLILFRNLLVVGDYIGQHLFVDLEEVVTLFKCNTEHLFPLQVCRTVCRVDLDDVISTLALGFQNLQSLRLIARCNDTVRNFTLDHLCSGNIADIRQRNKITVRRHTVCASCSCICTSQRRQLAQVVYEIDLLQRIRKRCANCCAGRRYVLEGRCCAHTGSLFQLRHQLPAVESIQQVDIARLAVQHSDRQIAAAFHIDAGRLLVRVTAVF